ncbi:MAG: non-canonical purine NTP pyrophosphatase, partial [Candidatus Paceibacterota bacterium]
FEIIFLKDLGVDSSGLLEDGETFKENAYKKAKYYYDKTGLLTLAEDSGILVDVLAGELGVKTRRWGAGETATDEEWIEYFLKKMEKVPNEKRGAKFVCVPCLLGEGIEKFFEGETRGVLTREIAAPILPGLPLSSCFVPNGFEKVYAALTTEEKNKTSHRGKAFLKVKEFLENL